MMMMLNFTKIVEAKRIHMNYIHLLSPLLGSALCGIDVQIEPYQNTLDLSSDSGFAI